MTDDRKAAAERNARFQALYDTAQAAALEAERRAREEVNADLDSHTGTWGSVELIILDDGFSRFLRRRQLAGTTGRGGSAVIGRGIDRYAINVAYISAFDEVISAAGIPTLRNTTDD